MGDGAMSGQGPVRLGLTPYIISQCPTSPNIGALSFVCADIGGTNYDNGFWWKKKPLGAYGDSDNIMRLDVSGNLTVGEGTDGHPFSDTAGSVRFNAHLTSIHDVLPNKGAMSFNCANDTVGNQNNGFHWRKANLGMTTTYTQVMRLTNSGRLYIGDDGVPDTISFPEATLELGGASTAVKVGGGSWSTPTSDQRTKADIQYFTSGLNCITGLLPTTFRYNGAAGVSNTGDRYHGFIAQEVQPVAPFMVTSRKKALYLGEAPVDLLNVDANSVPYMLINSIKELNTTISTLQSENAELRTRLDNAGL